MVLSGEIDAGDKARVDVDGDDLKFDVEKGAASQEVSDWSEEARAQTPEPAATR
jgi:hypothetical protein